MRYDIYLCTLDRSKVVQLPILPEKLPELVYPFKNEEFETFSDGDYNFMGNAGLITFTLESYFPEEGKTCSFAKSDAKFVDLLDVLNNAYNKNPIRVMFSTTSGDILNDTFTIESFSYYVDKNGDYQFKIDFKQYREVT